MHPEKIRRGSHFVYNSEKSTTYMNFHDATEYCYTNHAAELPSVYIQEDSYSLAAVIYAERNGMWVSFFSVQAKYKCIPIDIQALVSTGSTAWTGKNKLSVLVLLIAYQQV